MNPDATTPIKRGRGRPRKVATPDEAIDSVWVTKANAARLIQVSHTTINRWIGPNPPPLREPIEVGYLSNGDIRIRAASVLAQVAVRSSVILAASLLAVEQLSGTIVSPALPRPAGMGLETGEVLASGAGLGRPGWIDGEWDHFVGAVGDIPTGSSLLCVGRGEDRRISPVISPVDFPIARGFQQGGRGSDRGAGCDGAMGFKEQKISALAGVG